MHLSLYSIIMHLCIHQPSQHTKWFRHQKSPSCCLSISTPPSPCQYTLSLTPNLSFPSNILPFYVLHKKNHTVCNLLRLAFFTQHNSLEIHPSGWIYHFSLLGVILSCAPAPRCLPDSVTEAVSIVPSLGLLWIKLPQMFVCGLLSERKLSPQGWNRFVCSAVWQLQIYVLKFFSTVAVQF